jgi:cell division protein ZapB
MGNYVMSSQLLQQLEAKVEQTVETIELLRLQVEELEQKNTRLQDDNNVLKDKHEVWEKTLYTMLNKLSGVDNTIQDSEKSIIGY